MNIWRWQGLQRGGGVTELDFTSADEDDDDGDDDGDDEHEDDDDGGDDGVMKIAMMMTKMIGDGDGDVHAYIYEKVSIILHFLSKLSDG